MTAPLQGRAFAGVRSDDFVFAPLRVRNRAKSFALVPGAVAGIAMGMNTPGPVRTIVADEAALLDWLGTARPGDRFTYHIGHLAADRARETSGLAATAREMLGRVADHVMALAADDLLTAAQRRLGDGRTAYLAIKVDACSARRRPPGCSAPGSVVRITGVA
ncbi:MAG: hypothetical protein AB7T39_21140 [Alphaproteobacteria bacterium]